MVYGAIAMVTVAVAGAPWKYPAGLIGLMMAAVPLGWQFLKEYQKMRIRVFSIRGWIPWGPGYGVIQSRIAVGDREDSWAKSSWRGWSKLRFLPEPHTDFIFSVYCEEFGFIGAVGMLFSLGYSSGGSSRRPCAQGQPGESAHHRHFRLDLVSDGEESIGMSMGLLPVTGLPCRW